MKILFVAQKLGYSSTTSYSLELALALRERGHELRIVSSGGEQVEAFREAGFATLTAKFNYFAYRKLIQLIREFGPEIVHVQNLRSLGMGQRILGSLGLPHVVTVHHLPRGAHEELRDPALSGVLAVNEVVRESLVNYYRLDKRLIRVVPAGVNLERLQPGEPPLSSGPNSIPVIGALGRLGTVKGYHRLIAAARRVLDEGIEAHFIIVGDGEEARRLHRQVRELQLEESVTFCPPLPDLPGLLGTFDIVVVPTLRGGLGLTALEAMAMGRPVVASAVGEVLQVVLDGETGLLVPEGEPDPLADKILQLLEDPDLARELGRNARSWAEHHCSLGPMVDATEEVYQEVLEDAFLGAGAARP